MMKFIRSLGGALFILVALLMAGAAAEAQTFRGTILGTVTDTSGAAVAGATVTVKNADTGLTRTVITADDGSYSAPELPIGNYNVEVERQGFKLGTVTGIRVEVSSERRADITLQAGQLAQRIEVSADSLPQVESTENTLGGIIQSNVVTNLPVNGGDYQKLIFLVPGVAGSPDEISDSPGSYGTFSVNGARGRSNNFLLDGTDMNDGYRNDPAINEAGVFGTPATILPVEAIAEMRVASNFESEYGRSAGAVINIVTKSGTNGLHGSAFDHLRNTVLNARNYFNQVGSPKQPFHDNQFGGALGGPIRKDKTFFFADYEGVREIGSQSSLACVPTAADYANNAPTPGDITSINPVIQNLINAGKAWPTPAGAAPADCYANGGTNTTLATPFSNRVDSAIAKIDHSFNANNLLTGRYYFGDSLQSFPLALSGGGLVGGYNTVTPTRVQLISLSYVRNFSISLLNEARLGWNRFAEGFFPEDRKFDPSSIHLDTVGAGTPNNGNPYNFGLPVISITGASFPQLGADKADPKQRVDTNWHFIDGVSWKAGKHDIKFGYEFRRTSIAQKFNRNYRGRLRFATFPDFLAGTPAGNASQYTGNSNRNTFENSHAAYVQDSFHATRKLVINLGLRYDYFGVVQEKNGLFSNVDPKTGNVFAVGKGQLYQPDRRGFAPRISAAWDLTGRGKTVIRAGYGIFYDAFSQDMFLGHLPYTTNFAPGAAYSGLAGPGQIRTSGAGTLAPDVPVFASFQPVIDEFGVDPKIRSPYMQNFNLNLQQELTHKMVLQLGYVGSTGHHLYDFRDINQPSAATIKGYNYAAFGCCVPGPLNGSTFRNVIYWQESAANSNYHSLQASWRINGWHGLTSSLNYTWSHSIDTASDGEDYVPNAAQPTDNTNLASNKGNSNFDVRNRLTWAFIYEFPTFGGSWQRLKNGWGFDGIVTAQSGQPFHLIYTFDDYDGSGTFFPKPDIVGPIKYNYHDPTHFLDLSSFAVPCTLDGVDIFAGNCVFKGGVNSMHFGNEGRNSLVGPNFRQFDFTIHKNTSLTEHVKLELRLEAYNLFNHPNFASPLYPGFLAAADVNGIAKGTDPASSVCHNVATGHSCGFYPLTVTGDVGIGYPFLGGGGPRSLQIAAKFVF
ncbi:MAG TPA: carboxypeptidase regulatory-like domain-containing protein [Candidatus Dormibacteraeota bacterium]|nr:carboxypeptidase regulatory-like domain-containing protein [Candidatus Dormibacteraeota bacterium]